MWLITSQQVSLLSLWFCVLSYLSTCCWMMKKDTHAVAAAGDESGGGHHLVLGPGSHWWDSYQVHQQLDRPTWQASTALSWLHQVPFSTWMWKYIRKDIQINIKPTCCRKRENNHIVMHWWPPCMSSEQTTSTLQQQLCPHFVSLGTADNLK